MADQELHSLNYDVFLSFRGEDTRKKFIRDLRRKLKAKHIRTFIDDDMLKAGDDISPKLNEAIEESIVLIVVLSQNYATSTWCLKELVKILQCSKQGNQQLVFPIFYHVDLQHQTDKYKEAMAAHENRHSISSEQVREWRSALNQVCELEGQYHINTRNEINIVEEIVNKVYGKIVSKPFHGKNPVGFEQRIEEVKSLLGMKLDDDTVCMLGIYGLGGIGKTEMAKALFSKIAHRFEVASFIENVRHKYSNNMNDLQKITLLSSMFETDQLLDNSTNRGIHEIKSRLGKKKTLLILDDVDDIEQLNNLAGGCDWFGPGSRIIITTTDEHLLHLHGVEKTYKMVELNDQQSLELFCQNAFGNSTPNSGYEDLSDLAVKYAKGLPLALKSLGSDLEDEDDLGYWKCTLEEYKMDLNPSVQDVLQRCYENLDKNSQQVFLDIACFFKGERIEYVEDILKEFDAPRSIELLAHKSLLTIEDGCLNMNGLIQDMARVMVRREAPNNPGRRSRLWSHEDIIEVLTEDMGSEAIEGIMLDPAAEREKVYWSGTAFEKMKNLRILIVRNTSFSTEPKRLPNNLRLLDWEEYYPSVE